MKLSPHFALSEFLVSSTRPDLVTPESDVPPEVVESLTELAETILEPIRAEFETPVTILSGYRSDALNRAVGGSATSQHRVGQAADFGMDGADLRDVFDWIRDVTAVPFRFGQVILYRDSLELPRFLHVSLPSVKWTNAAFVQDPGVYLRRVS